MTFCERCTTALDSSDALYTSAGECVCPSCFDDSQVEDQSDRASSEGEGKSNVAVVFGVLALVCALARLALVLAG